MIRKESRGHYSHVDEIKNDETFLDHVSKRDIIGVDSNLLYLNVSSLEDLDVRDLEIRFSCIALKKAQKQTDFSIKYHIYFNEFHYSIFFNDIEDAILIRPYGQLLTDIEIKRLANLSIRTVIDQIKDTFDQGR